MRNWIKLGCAAALVLAMAACATPQEVNTEAPPTFTKTTALLLAREGAAVCVADVNVEGGKRVVEQIKSEGGHTQSLQQLHSSLHAAPVAPERMH